MTTTSFYRRRCLRCFKPNLTCVCRTIPNIPNRTNIAIVQHPRERFHALGTARFALLGLNNVVHEVAHAGFLNDKPRSIHEGAWLLYPSANAVPIESLPASPSQLVVIDGTWHHAHTLVRDLGWLATMPRVAFVPTEPSRYRIRREPNRQSVSTIEAIVTALQVMEPETPGLDSLLQAFDHMIDSQISLRQRRPQTRRVNKSLRPVHVIPRVLKNQKPWIIAYAESVPTRQGRHLVQLCASNQGSYKTLELFIRPPEPVDPIYFRHMSLPADHWLEAIALDQLDKHWMRFCPEPLPILAWSPSTLKLLYAAGVAGADRCFSLKALYSNAFKRKPGTLETILERENLQTQVAPMAGRAARRLGRACTLAGFLEQKAARGC